MKVRCQGYKGLIVFLRASGKGGESSGWDLSDKARQIEYRQYAEQRWNRRVGKGTWNVRLSRFDPLSAWYKRKSLKFTISGCLGG